MAELTHIRELTPDPKNRRAHNPRNIGMVVDALHAVGAARSIVIDEDGVILAGNGVVEAAGEAGITRLRVVEADGQEIVAVRRTGLSEAQKRHLAMTDNRAAELAEWDTTQLWADQEAGLDLKPWFSAAELKNVFGHMPVAGKTDPDAVPEARATEIVRGDLFELGAHRLLCGDCTAHEAVSRLMASGRADIVFTDPPYGVDYSGGTKARERLAGDTDTQLYGPACAIAAQHSDEKAPLYLWHAGVKGIAAAAAAAAAGYEIRCEIVWNKNQAQFGSLSAQYKQKHEPCYYCHKRGHAPRWFGPTNEVTVWDCDRSAKNEFHPTQKPVELAIRALTNSSMEGHVVLDLFGGSGSTLIGCEQALRCARLVEIDPTYCQVIIDRWEAFTGQKAVKVGEAVRA